MTIQLFTIVMFAARRSDLLEEFLEGFEQLVPFIMLGFGIVGLITYFIIEERKKNKCIAMQQAIDESNRLYYNKWHRYVQATGTISPLASPLMLKAGEECLRIENNVTLFEVRAVRHATHTFGSVPIGKTRIRIGRGYTTSESNDEWRPIAEGTLYITNKQIYFDGDKQDRKVPLTKISTLKADWSAIEVSSDTRQKSMVFSGVNGMVCREIVQCSLGQDVFNM